jgi:transcriptional regulator with XRE-family HTH domain
MSGFAKLLQDKRRSAGITQRRLAEQAGVDFSYISKMENGHLPPPSAETIERFAGILGCPAEELLAGAGKLPLGLNELPVTEDAVRFFREVATMNPSDEEWRELAGVLRKLSDERTSF